MSFYIADKYDLADKKFLICDIFGTLIANIDNRLQMREGIEDFFKHYNSNGGLIALATDGYKTQEKPGNYQLNDIIKEDLEYNISKLLAGCSRDYFSWVNECKLFFGREWMVEVNEDCVKDIEHNLRLPFMTKDFCSMIEAAGYEKDDCLIMGDCADEFMAQIADIAYFPIPPIGSLDYREFIV